MNTYFADTSYLLALELGDDQNHHSALTHWTELLKTTFAVVTTSYVFDETITYLNSRNHHEKAVEVGENLLLSPSVELVHVDENLFFEGWTMFQKYADKKYSLTDCISFVVMKQRELDTALTFDKHFVQAGFKTEP
ncbi:MAG TPA: PIN domain-containing protein [Pyrinomonadaceae bacterium]|jgi:predicted nucleic acid-binding protein